MVIAPDALSGGSTTTTSGKTARPIRRQTEQAPAGVDGEAGVVGAWLGAVRRFGGGHGGKALPHALGAGQDDAGRERVAGNRAREAGGNPPVTDDVAEGHGVCNVPQGEGCAGLEAGAPVRGGAAVRGRRSSTGAAQQYGGGAAVRGRRSSTGAAQQYGGGAPWAGALLGGRVAEDPARRVHQRVDDGVRFQVDPRHLLLRPPVAGPDEDAARSDVARQADLPPLVPDDHGAGDVEVQIAGRLLDHPRLRLAAVALAPIGLDRRVRVVRTVVVAVELLANRAKLAIDQVAHGIDDRLVLHPARNADLVGDDDHGVAGAPQQEDGIERPGEELQAVDPLQIADIFVHGAVAIEKNGWFHVGPLWPRCPVGPPARGARMPGANVTLSFSVCYTSSVMKTLALASLVGLLLLVFERPAAAYLDPGSGSMLLQVLLGGFAAVGVALRLYWGRISELFSRKQQDHDTR